MNPLLKEELHDVEEVLDEAAKQRFQITDLDSLNWTFRKLSALKEKEKEIKTLAEKEKMRIEHWERQELSSVTSSMDFFHSLIAEYHAAVLTEDPKKKTLSTPYGKAKAKSNKEQPESVDKELILNHVIESNMDEFIKQDVKWGDLKKSLKIVEISGEKVVVDGNGQIVPGVAVKPESISYSVEV
jgi:hypothetical protein